MNADTFVVQISFSIWAVIQFTKLISYSKIHLQHDRKPLNEEKKPSLRNIGIFSAISNYNMLYKFVDSFHYNRDNLWLKYDIISKIPYLPIHSSWCSRLLKHSISTSTPFLWHQTVILPLLKENCVFVLSIILFLAKKCLATSSAYFHNLYKWRFSQNFIPIFFKEMLLSLLKFVVTRLSKNM